jgi:translation elongation factor EF-Tu-like GTPase
VSTADFEFLVENSVTVTGRGVAVFGTWREGQIRSGDRVYLHTDADVVPIDEISIEYARLAGGEEQVVLLLRGLTVDQVPAGAVVRSRR